MTAEEFAEYIPHLTVTVTVLGTAVGTTLHAIFHKEDNRSAVGWIGLVWLSPLVGAVLYALLGVNRIRRQAKTLRGQVPRYLRQQDAAQVLYAEDIATRFDTGEDSLSEIARIGDVNIDRHLLGGNSFEPLYDGDEVYPAMLEAIGAAATSITLLSYIFDNDPWGRRFVEALAAARDRGVEVRVLIDAAGNRYSFPAIVHVLRKRKVKAETFLPSSLFPPYILSVNLRNHRKILVVDGRVGFTGGMNIRAACVIAESPRFPTRDLHFRVRGPVVAQLQEIFAEDWGFATREVLDGEVWFPKLEHSGVVVARGIPDGPDEDLDKLRWTLLGAISSARRSIRIVTPYFLPDQPLREALIVARMRGVDVRIVLPGLNNLPFVAWAAMGELEPLLAADVEVCFSQGIFNHSKLTTVDDAWALVGSPNWDPRSLRLNFEFAVECYDRDFVARMNRWIDDLQTGCATYTLERHLARNFPTRLIHGIARLGAPYL